jgi:hypothetical protein
VYDRRALRLGLDRSLAILRDTRLLIAVAAIVAGLQLLAAAGHLDDVVRTGYDRADAGFLVRDADLDPLSFYMPTASLALARESIPPDATYTVVVGDDPPVADPGVVRFVFRFWLLPRRYTSRLSEAEWVIGYHRSSESLGVPYVVENGLGPDANVVRVDR